MKVIKGRIKSVNAKKNSIEITSKIDKRNKDRELKETSSYIMNAPIKKRQTLKIL